MINKQYMTHQVAVALAEDVGDGDCTAALIDEQAIAKATLISRSNGILCGTAWVDEVFRQLNDQITLHWFFHDGDLIQADQVLCHLQGSTRILLTGERCALNFLQTLSGTASTTYHYTQLIAHTKAKLLDTRKTIPGWRAAQKYAVTCGGGYNHRFGLYDAILIKENHITACGSITAALQQAKQLVPENFNLEIEVESLDELKEALAAGATHILLDNFNLTDLKAAVSINQEQAILEGSGNINQETLIPIAETGIHTISMGALTKNLNVLDLSMRITNL